MDDLTRRSFVRGSAGAAAGLASFGAIGVADAGAHAPKHAQHSHPIVAWLGDPRDGTITVMSGDREIKIHDHALAARIEHIARKAH